MNDKQTEILARALRRITDHPEEHDQEVWFRTPGLLTQAQNGRAVLVPLNKIMAPDSSAWDCGTAACLAGHILFSDPDLDNGAVLEIMPDGHAEALIADGVGVSIATRARFMIGLSPIEAKFMFSAVRSVPELWIMAEIVSDGRITPPRDLGTRGFRDHEGYLIDDAALSKMRRYWAHLRE